MGNTKKWTTKSGSKLRIKDMTTDHIFNVIKMLERSADRELNYVVACGYGNEFSPDSMASYYAESEADFALEKGSEEFLPDIYYDLKEELESRKDFIFFKKSYECK